jgi:two-component system alkaline phosphatase synthesis response regulator PhoP
MVISRVLVAEDEAEIQKVIKMSLKFQGVEEVFVVGDGEQCLASVAQINPHLILLDIGMPKLDGYETCRRLKQHPATRSIPVIFLTAKTQNSEEEIGLEAGASGYITKPFDPMTLLGQIQDILEREASAKAHD